MRERVGWGNIRIVVSIIEVVRILPGLPKLVRDVSIRTVSVVAETIGEAVLAEGGEIALQHIRRPSEAASSNLVEALPRSLVIAEDEELIFYHWARQRTAKLVAVDGICLVRKVILGIEPAIAVEVEYIAMQALVQTWSRC